MAQSDKVLVVTGGSRGIGAACARLAARDGWAVCVNYASNRQAADEVVADIEAAGGVASAVQGDVSDAADVDRIFAGADAMGRVTGLVNNAGVVDLPGRVDELDAARLSRMWAINVTGSFLSAGRAIRRMSSKNGGAGGAIVNITSAAAKMGAPGSMVHYAASKGAIDSFTIGLALEVAGEGIRVNAVRPGLIDTDIHASAGDPDRMKRLVNDVPAKRIGTAEEVAEAVVWLLGDKASYTTGTTIEVSGGRAISP